MKLKYKWDVYIKYVKEKKINIDFEIKTILIFEQIIKKKKYIF